MEPQADGTSSSGPKRTSPDVTSTAYYYFDTWILAQAARILGNTDDARRYSALAERIKVASNREFLDRATNQYGSGSQTANALALSFGLVPEERIASVERNLVEDIVDRHDGHLSTGIVGTNALEQVLADIGAAEVMYAIATQTTFPSWGYQVLRGATTVWETWEDAPERQLSLSMKMLGSSQKFFYKDLAGISPETPGYRDILIKPCVVEELHWTRATVRTVRGVVEMHWAKVEGGLDVRLSLPTNAQATIKLPTLGLKDFTITESGFPLWIDNAYVKGIAGIASGRRDGDFVALKAGGGRYFFRLRG
jgi:alpha-L-rhamnosidase